MEILLCKPSGGGPWDPAFEGQGPVGWSPTPASQQSRAWTPAPLHCRQPGALSSCVQRAPRSSRSATLHKKCRRCCWPLGHVCLCGGSPARSMLSPTLRPEVSSGSSRGHAASRRKMTYVSSTLIRLIKIQRPSQKVWCFTLAASQMEYQYICRHLPVGVAANHLC